MDKLYDAHQSLFRNSTQHVFGHHNRTTYTAYKEALTRIKCGKIAIGPRYGLDDRHAFIELNQVLQVTVVSQSCLDTPISAAAKLKQQSLYGHSANFSPPNTHRESAENGTIHTAERGSVVREWFPDKKKNHADAWSGVGAYAQNNIIQSKLGKPSAGSDRCENFTSQKPTADFYDSLTPSKHKAYQANSFWEMMKALSNKSDDRWNE